MTPVEEWFFDIPVVTRVYITTVFLTTLACQLELVSPIHLFYSWDLVKKGQYWRLISSFLYVGNFSLDFLFHMFFLVRYSRMLEEGSFRGRTIDFVWLLIMGATCMMLVIPLLSLNVPFLSQPLTFMLVYIWSRRNPFIRMNFLGLFNFTAPYLPWVLMGFTVLMHNHFPTGDLVGMALGHVYYFFEDVYPRMPNSQGKKYLATPGFVKFVAYYKLQWWMRGRQDNAEVPTDWTIDGAQDTTPSSDNGWEHVNESSAERTHSDAGAHELRQRNPQTSATQDDE